jgi:hypothetical protein
MARYLTISRTQSIICWGILTGSTMLAKKTPSMQEAFG